MSDAHMIFQLSADKLGQVAMREAYSCLLLGLLATAFGHCHVGTEISGKNFGSENLVKLLVRPEARFRKVEIQQDNNNNGETTIDESNFASKVALVGVEHVRKSEIPADGDGV